MSKLEFWFRLWKLPLVPAVRRERVDALKEVLVMHAMIRFLIIVYIHKKTCFTKCVY